MNLPGIRDPRELALLEKFTVALRVRDLRAGDPTYPAYGDVESIRNLHLAIFQDLYPSAGELRTVEVGVEHRDRVAPVAEIRPVLEAACGLANDPAWHRMGREDFAWRAAEIHALLEYAHPFVIGNGVTAREFLADVASVGPYSLDVEAWGWLSGPLAVSAVTRDPDGTYRAYPGPAAALAIHRALSVDGEALRAERDHAELAPSREVLAAVGDPGSVQVFADRRAVEDQWWRDRVWTKQGRSPTGL
ncbi:MAG: hypothetical protein EOL89_06090, partial [Actinobacteria bacterium]|nr:hypothetical protein [Actinomycetota bacterium]